MEGSVEAAESMPAEDEYDKRIKELNTEKQRASYELYKLNTERYLTLRAH